MGGVHVGIRLVSRQIEIAVPHCNARNRAYRHGLFVIGKYRLRLFIGLIQFCSPGNRDGDLVDFHRSLGVADIKYIQAVEQAGEIRDPMGNLHIPVIQPDVIVPAVRPDRGLPFRLQGIGQIIDAHPVSGAVSLAVDRGVIISDGMESRGDEQRASVRTQAVSISIHRKISGIYRGVYIRDVEYLNALRSPYPRVQIILVHRTVDALAHLIGFNRGTKYRSFRVADIVYLNPVIPAGDKQIGTAGKQA